MEEQMHALRHSAAHVLAAAIQKIYPEARFGVGPVIEHGFYYDIALDTTLSDKELAKIEKTMHAIIQADLPFEHETWEIERAIHYFSENNQPYKVELLKDLQQHGTTKLKDFDTEDIGADSSVEKISTISVYKTGDFIDLCKGPHVASTGKIGVIKLHKIAGAYWRGDEKRDQLQRIYGLAFQTQDQLDMHLHNLALALERDHRKLGRELDLFTFSDLVGPGLPMFTPRGTILREKLTEFSESLQRSYGYEKVWIPHITRTELYKVSGHFDKYPERFEVTSSESDDQFMIKPMNCPHHAQIFASKPRSYRDLPLRYMETTTTYRDEKSGELHGLSRVRSITMDDAHAFCTEDQIESLMADIMTMIKQLYDGLQMDFYARLSFRDDSDKYLGDAQLWDKAQKILEKVVKDLELEYVVGVGEAAFYGPKIDIMVRDGLGREWQCATEQLDFVQPERLGLHYVDSDGSDKCPVMIHKALLGSIERFLAVYIEHTAGVFPVWLAPEQVRVIPVSDKFLNYAHQVTDALSKAGVRVELDDSNESLGKRIRNAEVLKIPYSVIVGERESANQTIAVRQFGEGDKGSQELDDFIQSITKKIASRQSEI
ncbi:threonine--tRNA ligase [Candidatus Saccharibacteria bacterium]|nr:threonine--tRNA ligase [Candidatus Saccharibacteria bacterium]